MIKHRRSMTIAVLVAALTMLAQPVGASWEGQIRPGDAVDGIERKHQLLHQGDGNVVLYDQSGNPVWHTKTYGTNTSRFVMQGDGNAVLYNAANKPIWHTGTHGNPGATLAVQGDGNIVVYKADGTVAWAAKHWPPKPPPPPPAPTRAYGVWDRLAKCESGGNWSINTGNGYYGGLQFNLSTWHSNGGSGYPHYHSRDEQIRVAEVLHSRRGFQPWPACSKKLGLR